MLAYYLTDSLGVAALAAGVVITVAKVWDVVIDPIIGALTDRDLAKHGTRRRLMLIGALSLPVLFALTFAVPPALGPVVGAVWVFFAFTLTATAFSLFQVPYIALPAELTPSYDERTRLLTWRVVVLTFAILLFGAGGPALRGVTGNPVTGYLVMGIVAGVVIAAGMLVATTVARRPVTFPRQPRADRRAPGLAEHGTGSRRRRGHRGDQGLRHPRALCRRHPGTAAQPALPRAAVHLRAAGARHGAHARGRAVRRDLGAALRRCRPAALRRAHRSRAVRGAGVGRRRASHRQGAHLLDRERRSSLSPRCRSSARCGRPATGSTRPSRSPASPTRGCSRSRCRCFPM